MTASVSGMGSIPLRTGGVAFRVWAQNARDVHVAGEFNGWSESANRLDPEGNGNWSVEVPSAQVGTPERETGSNPPSAALPPGRSTRPTGSTADGYSRMRLT